MNLLEFDDRLELFGVLAGVFVVIVGLGTLTTMPWSTAESTAAALVQLLGIVTTLAVGVAIVLVTKSEPIEELLPTN